MSGYVAQEVNFKIFVPNSTTPVFIGTGRLGVVHEVANNDTAAILTAEAVIIDSGATSVIGSPTETAAVTESINVIRIVTTTSVGILGVCLDGCKARTGASTVGMSTTRVAGVGSIVPVRTNGTATLGGALISSSTAGQVFTSTWAAGKVLGVCLVANASVGGVNIAVAYVLPQ